MEEGLKLQRSRFCSVSKEKLLHSERTSSGSAESHIIQGIKHRLED